MKKYSIFFLMSLIIQLYGTALVSIDSVDFVTQARSVAWLQSGGTNFLAVAGINSTSDVVVYSFNGTGLWLSKKKRGSEYLDDASRLSLWQGLLQHMDVEADNEDAMICLYQYYDLPQREARMNCPNS